MTDEQRLDEIAGRAWWRLPASNDAGLARPVLHAALKEAYDLGRAERYGQLAALVKAGQAEERRALREMLIAFGKEPPPSGHDRRRYVCNEILAALDAREKEPKPACACGIPGPEKERECHCDYYDGETFAIDSGGDYKETNVCACSCHAAAAAREKP